MSFAIYRISKAGTLIHVTPKPAPTSESAALSHARTVLKQGLSAAMLVTHDGVPTVGLHGNHAPPKALLAWKPERVEVVR